MPASKHQYLLRGELVATAPIAVSYVGLYGKLPRTPHGEVFLNSGTLRGPLRENSSAPTSLPAAGATQAKPDR